MGSVTLDSRSGAIVHGSRQARSASSITSDPHAETDAQPLTPRSFRNAGEAAGKARGLQSVHVPPGQDGSTVLASIRSLEANLSSRHRGIFVASPTSRPSSGSELREHKIDVQSQQVWSPQSRAEVLVDRPALPLRPRTARTSLTKSGSAEQTSSNVSPKPMVKAPENSVVVPTVPTMVSHTMPASRLVVPAVMVVQSRTTAAPSGSPAPPAPTTAPTSMMPLCPIPPHLGGVSVGPGALPSR